MQAFQPVNVDAIRSERVVCVIRMSGLRVKAFQTMFGKDGSLFITFPYFRHRTGLLSASAIPATGQRQSDVNLEHGGKVTSHRVKYSHHQDGRAHFSQDGKIFTSIKRQSIPLEKQDGHIFSLLIQGLSGLDAADPVKDATTSTKRAVIEFTMESTEAVKIVGRWYDVNKLRCSTPNASIGPVVPRWILTAKVSTQYLLRVLTRMPDMFSLSPVSRCLSWVLSRRFFRSTAVLMRER
jgi:hypothetical protein